MTADDPRNPTAMGLTSMTGTGMRALLLAALDSPTDDGAHADGAAGATDGCCVLSTAACFSPPQAASTSAAAAMIDMVGARRMDSAG